MNVACDADDEHKQSGDKEVRPRVSRLHEIVKKLQALGIQVIPWTVNKRKDMDRMIKMKVDGIITDYPNYIEEVVDSIN